MGISRLSRAMGYYRDHGFTVENTEHWNPWDRKTHDLFGIIDALAVGIGSPIGIQCCGGTDFAAHHRKIIASGHIRPLLASMRVS